jgi:hypothetical protein
MTNFERGSTKGSDTSTDPLVALMSALRDKWMLGAAVVENMLAQGAGASTGDPLVYAAGASKRTEMVSLIAQSYFIAANSGLRYLTGVAQIFGTHQSSILSSLLGAGANKQPSEEERREMAESIRAYLRELGDLALQEARLLQAELGEFGEAVACATQEDQDGPTPAHQRRWKAKS